MRAHKTTISLAFAILLLPFSISLAYSEEIVGDAGKVVDGDTLYVCDTAIGPILLYYATFP